MIFTKFFFLFLTTVMESNMTTLPIDCASKSWQKNSTEVFSSHNTTATMETGSGSGNDVPWPTSVEATSSHLKVTTLHEKSMVNGQEATKSYTRSRSEPLGNSHFG